MKKDKKILISVLILVVIIAVIAVILISKSFSERTASTAEPTPSGSRDETIGYAYFKGYSQADIDKDSEGKYYIRNQILLSAEKNLTYKDVSEIASEYGAEIVGYLETANDYQIEVQKDVSSDDLLRIISELKKNPNITDATLNVVTKSMPMSLDDTEPAVAVYYKAEEPSVSLEGYEPYAILYLTYGSDFENPYGDIEGVILYADGRAQSYRCASDLEGTSFDVNELVSDPESLAWITPLQSPSTKTVDDIFSQLKNIDPNSVSKISREISSTGPVIPEQLSAMYMLWAYYERPNGEYQRLLLDSKGLYSSNLVDPNAKEICNWFFEQQSTWGFDVFAKIW